MSKGTNKVSFSLFEVVPITVEMLSTGRREDEENCLASASKSTGRSQQKISSSSAPGARSSTRIEVLLGRGL
jgi:hypothetical protein